MKPGRRLKFIVVIIVDELLGLYWWHHQKKSEEKNPNHQINGKKRKKMEGWHETKLSKLVVEGWKVYCVWRLLTCSFFVDFSGVDSRWSGIAWPCYRCSPMKLRAELAIKVERIFLIKTKMTKKNSSCKVKDKLQIV